MRFDRRIPSRVLAVIWTFALMAGISAAQPVAVNQLRDLTLLPAADGARLEMTVRDPIQPRLQILAHPPRLVIDLPATSSSMPADRIATGKFGVTALRIGTNGAVPPDTRVVVDLDHECAYDLQGGRSGKLSILLHTAQLPPTRAADVANVKPASPPIPSLLRAALRSGSQSALAKAPSTPAPPQSATRDAKPVPDANAPSKASPPTNPKYTGEPISVNLKDVDLRDFFRLVHEISGLNVVLDPNVKGTLTLVLDDVPWDQALEIVLKNNNLARQLDGNVLRVATLETLRKEADSRREQQNAEALAVDKTTVTRFLSYSHAKDVVPTIKKFLTERGDVIADERTNAVIISDIPPVIPTVDRLLTQLDRKTQEVEIEARVVAATRSFARDIGTQLGFGWGNGHTAVGGAASAGTSPTHVFDMNPGYITVGGSASTPGTQIPLFSNLPVASPTSGLTFLNASNSVRVDAILTFAESHGLLKILSRPRVVTQNNIQALVRQGVRVPIVTQAQLGGPPTVTYVDAFLRLTVVPQITSEGTIFLNVDVENTTPDFGRTVQGNPTLITQQATTQVLVTDGGTVVIGGVIQTQNSVNVQQVPLLGDVPVLGNLFKHRSVTTSNQELIFFITPRVQQT